jgi:hypothetical protein
VAQPGSPGGGQPLPPTGAPTTDEATAALDDKLGSSTGEFDQRMHEELQRLAAEAAAREGGGGPPAGRDSIPGTGPGAGGATGETTSGGGSTATGEEGGGTSGAVGGSGPGTTGSTDLPPDVGDGSKKSAE